MGKWCRQHRSGAKRDHVTTLINRLLRLTRTQHIIAQYCSVSRERRVCHYAARGNGACYHAARGNGSGKRASRWGLGYFVDHKTAFSLVFLADRMLRRIDEMHCCMHLEARP